MIKKEFRVTVDIPEEVWLNFRFDQEFERDRIGACAGHLESGTWFYDQPFEWALFDTYEAAHACEEKLLKLMGKYMARLKLMEVRDGAV